MLTVEAQTKTWKNRMRLDLRNHKGANKQFRHGEREHRRIMDAISQGVIVLAPDGSVLYGNEFVLEYTGLTLAEVETGSLRALHPDDVERVKYERQTRLSGGIPFQLEYRVK